MRSLQQQVKVKYSKRPLHIFTLSVEDLYRKAEPILCPHITHDHVDIFWLSGAKVFLWLDFCLLGQRLVIVRPDLLAD